MITGHDRDEVGMLGVPDVEACRALCATWRQARRLEVVRASGRAGRAARAADVVRGDEHRQRDARDARAIVLDEPPSLDAGEVTDKGSLNQRAILAPRARWSRSCTRRRRHARRHRIDRTRAESTARARLNELRQSWSPSTSTCTSSTTGRRDRRGQGGAEVLRRSAGAHRRRGAGRVLPLAQDGLRRLHRRRDG